MDAVKQKRQLGVKQYSGTFDCMKRVVATEGIRALYAGYITTLVMNVPYSFVYFATYDTCRQYTHSGTSSYQLGAHLISGAMYVLSQSSSPGATLHMALLFRNKIANKHSNFYFSILEREPLQLH